MTQAQLDKMNELMAMNPEQYEGSKGWENFAALVELVSVYDPTHRYGEYDMRTSNYATLFPEKPESDPVDLKRLGL